MVITNKVLENLNSIRISGKYDTKDCATLELAMNEIAMLRNYARQNLKQSVKTAIKLCAAHTPPKNWSVFNVGIGLDVLRYYSHEQVIDECANKVANFFMENNFVLTDIVCCHPKRTNYSMDYTFFMLIDRFNDLHNPEKK